MRLSIVMAARNAEAFVGKALHSISGAIGNSGVSHEILLADGQSSDRTREIFAAHPNTKIVSTADTGIYDGMNRASAAAGGDYIAILNADDEFLPGGLAAAIDVLEADTAAAFASGNVIVGSAPTEGKFHAIDVPLSAEGILFGIPAINARVFRRDVMRRLGPMRTDIGLGADREFLMRVMSNGLRGKPTASPLYFYRVHTGSHTVAGDRNSRRRVYESDLQLADFLSMHADLVPTKSVAAFRTLARLKIFLLSSSASADAGNKSGAPSGIGMRDIRLLDALRGIRANRRWRSRISGW